MYGINVSLDVMLVVDMPTTIYSSGITHNMNKMAEEAGIYMYLWRPEEIGITTAAELIEPLTLGLELLKGDPDKFKKFNPANGWGTYEQLVDFVAQYLHACIQTPSASVAVCR